MTPTTPADEALPKEYEAYYYSFTTTGNPAIDKILEAVARAGKRYHNTADWNDGDNGPSAASVIQTAANEAVTAWNTRAALTPKPVEPKWSGSFMANADGSIATPLSVAPEDEALIKTLGDYAKGFPRHEEAAEALRRRIAELRAERDDARIWHQKAHDFLTQLNDTKVALAACRDALAIARTYVEAIADAECGSVEGVSARQDLQEIDQALKTKENGNGN